uniref:Uncharacterized protein n=1 Tax=Aegilops tauschii TaxID=37682 RepID=M8C9C7_AEGTA
MGFGRQTGYNVESGQIATDALFATKYNAVKNHWNATKRSLNAKRHLKKRNSEQPPPGQLSLLMEYIRSLDPHTESPTETPPVSPPLYHDQQHGGKMGMAGTDSVVVIAPTTQAYPSYPNPAMTGMYYHPNPTNMQYWAPDLNVVDGKKRGMVSEQDIQQAANASMNMYAFIGQHTLPTNNLKAAVEMHRESSTKNQQGNMHGGAGGWSYYYGMDAAGPSGPAGGSGSGNDPDGIDMV